MQTLYRLYESEWPAPQRNPGQTTGTLPYANAGIVTGAKAP